MGTDPKPAQRIVTQGSQRTIVPADTHGPEMADFFEMKGWMPRIPLPERKVPPGQVLGRRRELRQGFTKAWCERGIYRETRPLGCRSRIPGARTVRSTGQNGHPLRSAGRTIRPIARTPREAIGRLPPRSPRSLSHIDCIPTSHPFQLLDSKEACRRRRRYRGGEERGAEAP